MQDFIKNIEILNFKSIKNVKLNDCSRINLFIGKPNVGKSNFLEALSLFSLPYYKYSQSKKITDFIRMENEPELFFDGNIENTIKVTTNIGNSEVKYSSKSEHDTKNTNWLNHKQLEIELTYLGNDNKFNFNIDDKFRLKSKSKSKIGLESLVKKYTFNSHHYLKNLNMPFLLPAYGDNLLNIISIHKELKDELGEIFAEYGLELVFDKASQSIKIIKRRKGKELFLIPYTSIADTLQRIIFFKSAIASNTNSILLFEEPEAHSFPPYTVHITQQIINTRSNQYFISTHSPFIVNDFLEHSRDELSIFMFDYKKGETVIRKLNKEEIYDIYQYGIDLFSNNESFLK